MDEHKNDFPIISVDYFELRLVSLKLFNTILDSLKICTYVDDNAMIIISYRLLLNTFDTFNSLRILMEKSLESDDADAIVICATYHACISKYHEYEGVMLKDNKCPPFNKNMKERCLSAFLLGILLIKKGYYINIKVLEDASYHREFVDISWYYEQSKILLTSIMIDSDESRDDDFMKILENHLMIKHNIREIDSIIRDSRIKTPIGSNY